MGREELKERIRGRPSFAGQGHELPHSERSSRQVQTVLCKLQRAALAWVHKGHVPRLAKAGQPGAVGRKLDKARRAVGRRRQAGRRLVLHAGLVVVPVTAPPGCDSWGAHEQALMGRLSSRRGYWVGQTKQVEQVWQASRH